MNDTQLISRLAGTDAYAADVPVPDEIWMPDIALRQIERRKEMQTQETPTQTVPAGSPPTRKRWVIPSLTGAAAVVVAIVLAVALAGGEDEPLPPVGNTTVPTTVPESAPLTPLEIGEALNQAALTGDWEAERLLYAEGARYTNQVAVVVGLNAPENTPMTEPATLYETFPIMNVFDWDGDGTSTILDAVASNTMVNYATGVTTRYSCKEVDATTLFCDILGEGYPFYAAAGPNGLTHTYTVVDGRMTEEVSDGPLREIGSALTMREYHDWVRASHAELDVDGALFETWGGLLITADTVETHRELIAEWRAQR